MQQNHGETSVWHDEERSAREACVLMTGRDGRGVVRASRLLQSAQPAMLQRSGWEPGTVRKSFVSVPSPVSLAQGHRGIPKCPTRPPAELRRECGARVDPWGRRDVSDGPASPW